MWTGANTTEYDEVDRHRALQHLPGVRKDDEFQISKDTEDDGDESRISGRKVEGYPDFGHAMLDYFQFKDGCKFPLCLVSRVLCPSCRSPDGC